MLVEISEFNRDTGEAVFENKHGKIRLSFGEWKRIVDAYDKWFKKEP